MQRIAQARDQFFEQGLRPTGLVGEGVIQSWMRCTSGRQVARQSLEFNPVTASRKHATLNRNRELLEAAQQELLTMEAALAGIDCRVLLTDAQGVIVHATHNPMAAQEPLLGKACRVGVNLSEAHVGTTAPGIVTLTGQACTVTGAEHYFDCLSSFECAAAPIHDVHGQVAAVLDITLEGRHFDFDAASMVGVYATSIENRLLLAQSREHLLLRFQASPSLLATPMEALAGISATGQVAWLNGAAARLLGATAHGAARDVTSLFGLEPSSLLALTRHTGLTALRLPNGLGVWARASLLASDGLDFGHAIALSANKPPVSSSGLPTSLAPLAGEDAGSETEHTTLLPTSKLPAGARLSEHHNQMIDSTLAACGGNISKAARSLGVSRGLLYRHLNARKSEPQAVDSD
jgi:transcriptional regulator of acetoin/glycerol metabolism